LAYFHFKLNVVVTVSVIQNYVLVPIFMANTIHGQIMCLENIF